MSVNSLPSFAQAFSNHSLASIPGTNALPPIMSRVAGRKRSRVSLSNDDSDVRVKQEHDDPLPPDRQQPHLAHDHGGAPPPSSLMPSSSKKRRVTVSGGAPHPLHIDVRPPTDQSSSTPISPVVMGFTIQRDNPNAMEQVRSMISVKQKQKALIEQRRGSTTGVMSPIANAPPTPIEEQQQRSAASAKTTLASANNNVPSGPAPRTSRRSPNTVNPPRRLNTQQRAPTPPPVPPPPAQPSSLQQQSQPPTPQHSLPPPPISFARRRAALLGGKKKPADIVISPREAHTRDQFQPSIQSAPPIPQAGGKNAFYSGRFQMALPRLPNINPGDNIRRVAGNVPPTPTRLSMQINNNNVPNRSPPAPSVPIASTLVPPTPISLHRPGYSGDKAAFLAPFEVFYDALNDSKQLKTWLAEQLQKSQSLMQNLTQQQERLNETVESLVEKRVFGMNAEMTGLRRRVEDLEEALRSASTLSSSGATGPRPHPTIHNKHPLSLQNGVVPPNSMSGPAAPEAYTFPPAPDSFSGSHEGPSSASGSRLRPERPELSRRLSSPGWGDARAAMHHRSGSDNGGGSPAPLVFDGRRTSMSASRHEPPPPPHSGSSAGSARSAMQSPSQMYRERDNAPGSRAPPLSRQNSSQSASVPMVVVSGERDREREHRERERDREPTEREASRRAGSRRNSVGMSSPEDES